MFVSLSRRAASSSFGYGLFDVAHDLFELHIDHVGRIKCAFKDAMDIDGGLACNTPNGGPHIYLARCHLFCAPRKPIAARDER